MSRMIFVRHGETEQNAKMVITSGAPGGPLNERGAAQAHALAATLVAGEVSAVYASPLVRARQTAEILAAAAGVPVELRQELAECSVGDLEGRSDAQAFARFDSTADRWFHAADLDYPLGPRGETARSAAARVATLLAELTAGHAGETVMIVSHQTLLQIALTCLCANLPASFGHRRWIPNAGTVVTELHGPELHGPELHGPELHGPELHGPELHGPELRCLEWAGSPVTVEGGGRAQPV
jgi:broad specificity phosphatase PhoE